jgi:repressor LexA
LDCIRSYIECQGFPPTIREIGTALGIRSANGVACHLRALEIRGLLTRVPRSPRAIRLAERDRSSQQPAIV